MASQGRAAAVVLGAGLGRRLGAAEPKAFLTIGGRQILAVASAGAAAAQAVGILVVTCPPGAEDRAREYLADVHDSAIVVPGGATRQASVALALDALPGDVELVAVHDAARPFASPELFDQVLAAVDEDGPGPRADGAIPVVPIPDTVKRVRDGIVVGTEARAQLAAAQTPQGFRVEALRDAHARAAEARLEATDDAQVLEHAGYRVRVIAGDPMNFKITTLLDLARAEAWMGRIDG
jgi:2-C-methyl-D-erythritol 4-phosphate cytidylyltransferase / 2-C-methyl-D-erythritol 2,4-cyclodiphosphate synthase